MKANTIDEVIGFLDVIIGDCIQKSSRLGYFACLYKKVTLSVKQGIAENYFENGPRMEKLDVIFANRYLAAYTAYTQKQPFSKAWEAAFTAADVNKYTAIQHLFVGMNAHINLDLAVAAAEVSAGGDINALQNDFGKINDVISNLVNNVQTDLEKICFPMRLLRYVNNKDEKAVINFSIGMARKTAWGNAVVLSAMDATQQQQYIPTTDNAVTFIAQKILSPGFLLNLLMQFVRWFEPSQTSGIINYLNN